MALEIISEQEAPSKAKQTAVWRIPEANEALTAINTLEKGKVAVISFEKEHLGEFAERKNPLQPILNALKRRAGDRYEIYSVSGRVYIKHKPEEGSASVPVVRQSRATSFPHGANRKRKRA